VPLPINKGRQLVHTRTIDIKAFRRDDGLMDVEGRITDIKPFDHVMTDSYRAAGEPVHDLSVRITIDGNMEVQSAVASMDRTAHDLCIGAEPNFEKLAGLKIGPGWNRLVRERVGHGQGCTHIIEMLAQMASGAMQAMWSRQPGEDYQRPHVAEREMPSGMLNSCYAYREEGEFIKEFFPAQYKPEGN
jgi:hypothetical protein